MHGNTKKQRCEEILKYVAKHAGTTKAKVIDHMKGDEAKKMSSLVTTQRLLTELISSGKIKMRQDAPDSRNHYLFIDDTNHFFVLETSINEMQRFVNKFTKQVMKNNLARFNQDKHFRDFVRLKQLELFGKITWISVKINSYIKSVEDRETLNLRLSRVLLDSNKLNNVLTSSNEILDLLRESKISEKDFFLKS